LISSRRSLIDCLFLNQRWTSQIGTFLAHDCPFRTGAHELDH
jgi:hypothetical protein